MNNKVFVLLLLAVFCWIPPVHAQSSALVVSPCGSAPYSGAVGNYVGVTQDTHGNHCTSASVTSSAATPTDRGGTLTTGGTAQNAMASNTSRKGGWIMNPCSATEDLYVSTTTSATTAGTGDDADLAPCGVFSLVQSNLVIQSAVSVNAATTGHLFLGKETQ